MKVQKQQRMQKLEVVDREMRGDSGRAVERKVDSDLNICSQLKSQILL